MTSKVRGAFGGGGEGGLICGGRSGGSTRRIVIAGLRGESSIADLCRTEGINQNLYCRWLKDFLEAGKSGWQAIPHTKRPTQRMEAVCGDSPTEGVFGRAEDGEPCAQKSIVGDEESYT